MKKLMLCASCVFALAFVISGCASAPKTESSKEPIPEVAPAATTKPVDDALTALRDQMEALRTECLKYRLDTQVKDDWTAAEKVRQTGLDAYGKDYDLAKSSFEDAISRYSKIKSDGFYVIFAELDAALAKARDEAVAAGADSYYPEQFGLADTAAADSAAARASGDLSTAYDAAQLALLRYRILSEGMKAVALRQKIDKNDFAQYTPEELQSGDAKYTEAVASFGTADASALDSMIAALDSFRKVYNAGFKVLAEKEESRANEAKALCDSIKASRSMTKDYDAAMWMYDQGASAGIRDEWERAYEQYSGAAVALASVFEAATLKRNAADAAISAAKNRQQASSDLAAKADQLAPLSQDAEGYSEDPYVIETAAAEPAAPESTDSPETQAAPADQAVPADAASDPAPVEQVAPADQPDTSDTSAVPAPADQAAPADLPSAPAPAAAPAVSAETATPEVTK
jgi:hypothetical protein